MANRKISELTAASSVGIADLLAIVQSGTTKKATITQVRSAMGTAKLYESYGGNTDGALTQNFASERMQAMEAAIGDIDAVLERLDTGAGV